ncbi:DUF6044 family protein [Humidesulfovibrio sp.]
MTSPAKTVCRQPARSGWLWFLALAAIICLDRALGPYALVRFHDWFDDGIFSQQAMVRDMLEYGRSAWWNSMGGLPAFVGQKPPYDPLVLLYTLLPGWLGDTIFRIALLFLAGWGMDRLLRRVFGLSQRAAFFGATAFVLSCLLRHWVLVAWFPAMICWHLDLFDSGRGLPKRLGSLTGILAFFLLSYPVLLLPVYSVTHFTLLFLFAQGRERRWPLAGVVALWTAYLLLYVPVVSALLDYLPEINRVYQAYVPQGPMALLRSIRTALSFLPTDTPTLPLVLCSLFAFRLDATLRKAWLLLGLCLTLYLFGASGLGHALHGTPLEKLDLYHFRQATPFVFSLVAAVYVDQLLRRGLPPLWQAGLAVAVASLGCSADMAIRNGMMFAAALGFVAAARGGGFPLRRNSAAVGGSVAAAGLVITFMLTMGGLLTDISHVTYARAFGGIAELKQLRQEEKAPFRVGCLDLAPAVALSNGLETVGEKKVLFSRKYKDYVLEAIEPQLAGKPQLRAQAKGTHVELYLTFPLDSFTLRRDVVVNPRRVLSAEMLNIPMLEAMNVKYLISSKPVQGLEAFAEAPVMATGGGIPALKGTALGRFDRESSLPLWIYPLKDGFERAYMTGTTRLLATGPEVSAALGSAGLEGLRQTAYFAQDDPEAAGAPALTGQAKGTIRFSQWRSDRITLSGETDGPTVLMVTNNWHKGWRATVNGQSAPLLRANLAFQAVAIPAAGPFEVQISFDTPLIWALQWVSLAGLLLLASLLFWPRVPGRLEPATESPAVAVRSRAPQWAALCAAGLWSLSFLFLRVLTEPATSHRPMWYAWTAVTLMGLCFGQWWLSRERQLPLAENAHLDFSPKDR